MNAPIKEVDLHAAYEYHLEQKALRDRQWARETAESLADLVVCGSRGTVLEKMLHANFPKAPRGVVYTGIGLAVNLHQADLAIAQLEARILRAKLAEAGIAA